VRRWMAAVAVIAVLLGCARGWQRYCLRQVARERLDLATEYARLARQAREIADNWERYNAEHQSRTHIPEAIKLLRSSAGALPDRSQRLRWAAARPWEPLSNFWPPRPLSGPTGPQS